MGDQQLDGTAPVYSYWGEPAAGSAHAFTPKGTEQRRDGVPYAGGPPDRSKRCRAKDDTCMGWRVFGSDYCIGHARSGG